MNLEWLYSFIETIHHKSLSKASQHLNLTQPAISKQIRKLEEELGVELFKRTTQGIELTEAGRLLFERIQPVLNEINAIRAELHQFQQPFKMTVGTFLSLAAYFLPQIIVRLRQQSMDPKITVQDTSEELLKSLEDGQIDLALVELDSLPDTLVGRVVLTEPYFAVLPKNHLLSSRKVLSLHHLYEEPLVVHPPTCKIRQTILRMYEQHGFEMKVSMELNFGQSILGYVAAGAGLAIVPQILADHIGDLPLVAIPITDFAAQRAIKLVTRSKKLLNTMYPYFVAY